MSDSAIRLLRVLYRCDDPMHAEAMARAWGADVEVRAVDSDRAARHLMAELGDRVAAVIVDQADLVSAVNSPVFQDALTTVPDALRILLHNDLSLEAIQSLLKSRRINRCFNKPVDAERLASEIFAASLKLESSVVAGSESAPGDTQTPGVLIVDDEILATKYLKKQLEQSLPGVPIHTADSADAALPLIKEGNMALALVISDQRMPGMKGDQLLSTLRRGFPGMLRVLTSAYQEVDVALGAVNDGEIYQYLSKPWDVQEVLDCIRSALEQYARNQQSSVRKRDQLEQTHQRQMAARRHALHACLAQALEPLSVPELATQFLDLLAQIETLPPSAASFRASADSDLERDLLEGIEDALRLPLKGLHPPVPPACIQQMACYLGTKSSTAQVDCAFDDLHPVVQTLLEALETLRLASGLELSQREVSVQGAQLRIALRSPLTVLTHLLSPLTRVSSQLLGQQVALLLVMLCTRLLGGKLKHEGQPQTLHLELVFPLIGAEQG